MVFDYENLCNIHPKISATPVVWQEGVNSLLVVELLCPGTENEDLGETLGELGKPPTKWEVYESILRRC